MDKALKMPGQRSDRDISMIIKTRSVLIVLLLAWCLVGAFAAPSGDVSALVNRGDALMAAKSYPEALSAYESAISLDGNNFSAWNGKADALNRAGKFTEALGASDTALALDPASTTGWINRGYILYNLGRYDDELGAYETAIGIEPDNAQAWFNKGYALAGLKRYDEAIAAFDRVESIRPDYPNLAANRRIAVQLRDAAVPWYIRYAPVLAGAALIIIAGGLFLYRKKTGTAGAADQDTRQSRRRKERGQ